MSLGGALPSPSPQGPRYRLDPDSQVPLHAPEYGSTRTRAPLRPLVPLAQGLTELTGPLLGDGRVGELDHDLTRQHDIEPIGQRIHVSGRVLDGAGRPVPHTLIEIWQANAAGRYHHAVDRWAAPLDPGFTGMGRTLTDADGRYTFVSVRPGAYPWGNHDNAWRPAHIHFSLLGRAFTQRLVTQMYFPDDPLLALDPIYNAVRDERARRRLVSAYDHASTVAQWALAYRFDIVLRGQDSTPFEDDHEEDE
jgi:protocatechuate 3,4-dioxygenase beta subunit